MVPPRSAVPVEHTWDITNVFPTDAAWESAIEALWPAVARLESFRGRLAEGPQVAADCLDLSFEIGVMAARVGLYARMHYVVDTKNTAALGRQDRARAVTAKVAAARSFIRPELISTGLDKLLDWSRQHSRLKIYRHHLEDLREQQQHVRSAEVEQLLRQLSDPFTTATATHSMLTDGEMKIAPVQVDGQSHDVTHGTLAALMASPNREIRRQAWVNYSDAHLAFQNTLANCFSAGLKQELFRARAARFESTLDMALNAYHLPASVFHNLLAAFQRNLPTWHRYWDIRRRALKLDKLHPWDAAATFSAEKVEVPYATAAEWIVEGLRPLGDDYAETVRRGITEERWVDIYPNQGKRLGAHSTGTNGTHPFIFMNCTSDLTSLSTLAHEIGHSMHKWHTQRTQPLVYANYTLFAAEVASNFNQALVRDHLFRTNPDPRFQLAVLEEAMVNFHRYLFIMPTLARFELAVHGRVQRGEPIAAPILNDLMADLFAEAYGPAMEMDRPRVGITWAEFSTHIYNSYYPFTYATGIAGAHALAKGILQGRPGARDAYIGFLKAGSSMYPLEALRQAGVDLESPEVVDDAFGVLAGCVDRLEKLTLRS